MEISWEGGKVGGFCTRWQTTGGAHVLDSVCKMVCKMSRVPCSEVGRGGGHMFLILYARYHRYLAAYVGT